MALRLSRVLPLAVALGALVLAATPGCESKMEPQACDKIRGDAFALLNKAHHCGSDADCRQSEWPGCQKPINQKNFDTIKPMAEEYKKGKCAEPKIDCVAPPESYCKQGLCVHREKGRNENDPKPGEGDTIKME